MEPQFLKKLLNMGLCLFILAHISMLVVYVLPHERASSAFVGFSDLYMGELFHQEWDLFAPEPPRESLKLKAILFGDDGTPIDTIYPASSALRRHLAGTSITATKEVYMDRRFAQYLIEEGTNKADGLGRNLKTSWPMVVSRHYMAPYIRQVSSSKKYEYRLLVTKNDTTVFLGPTHNIHNTEWSE